MGDSPSMPEIPLPASLAERPRDPRRGLPIPPVSLHTRNGVEVVDFVSINGPVGVALATERKCSLCAGDMEYWVAFLGSLENYRERLYLDPPAHIECMHAAVSLCPYIALQHHRRMSARRVDGDTIVPEGFREAQPDRWLMGITRQYRVEVRGRVALYRPSVFKATRMFGYGDDGAICEIA